MKYRLKIVPQKRNFHISLILMILLIVPAENHAGLPPKRKINSVKSLTYILSMIEKESGEKAAFVTLKLQIYLEDLYISQGTPIILKPRELSRFIKSMIKMNREKNEMAKEILIHYKKGEFHDR